MIVHPSTRVEQHQPPSHLDDQPTLAELDDQIRECCDTGDLHTARALNGQARRRVPYEVLMRDWDHPELEEEPF